MRPVGDEVQRLVYDEAPRPEIPDGPFKARIEADPEATQLIQQRIAAALAIVANEVDWLRRDFEDFKREPAKPS